MKRSVMLTLFACSIYCNAQFQAVINEQQAGEFLSKDRCMKTPRKAEDIMDRMVYNTVLQPMLQSVQYRLRSDESKQQEFSEETRHATRDLPLSENITQTILTRVEVTTPESPSQCVVDLGYFQSDLQVGDLYALMMVDSYGKLPPGVFQGSITWPGLYDQCQSQSKSSNVTTFKGKHCLVLLYTTKLDALFPSLNIGMCVPDSCDGEQIMSLLNSIAVDIGYTVVDAKCTKEYEYSAAAIICLTTLAFLGVMIIIGTVYDLVKRRRESAKQNGVLIDDSKSKGEDINVVESSTTNKPNEFSPLLPNSENNVRKQNDSFWGKFLLCFSLLTNGGKILKTKQAEISLGALNGIRVLSLWWVILGHTYVFPLPLLSNPAITVDVLSRFTFQAVGNATFSVDSFFFLSGLLITYLTLKYLQRNHGKLNWVMFYVHRYLRLTPVYMLVIFIFTTLMPYFATGPRYSYFFDPNPAPGVENQLTYCQHNWWTNLLYINNLYPSNIYKECLVWSWYLANDMQFFVISPFVIYLLYHYFFIGVAAWGVLLITSFGSLIGISIKYNITTSLFPPTPAQKILGADEIYIRPWARISTYLVGMAVGYILYKYRGRVRMPHFMAILGWMAATGIGLAVVYGLYGNFHGSPLSEGASVVYITFSRFSWAVALAWIAFACATGYGGPVNSLLAWSFWIPLARISYCAYLLHPIIMFVFYYSLPTLIYFSDFLFVYFFLGHVVLSYAAAFVLSICAEAPFMALEKLVLNRDKSV